MRDSVAVEGGGGGVSLDEGKIGGVGGGGTWGALEGRRRDNAMHLKGGA